LPNSALNARRAFSLFDLVVRVNPALSYHYARVPILQHTLCERFAQVVSSSSRSLGKICAVLASALMVN